MAKRKARAASAPVALSAISEPSNEVTNVEDSDNELETTPTEIVSTESNANENITTDSETTTPSDTSTDEKSEDPSPVEEVGNG
ncbi:hypothetical protein [Pseudomonas phage fMGyn-Pae01]|nr:hypothetical protein [Pseudomonas phage fMGyn-Pae01]